MTTAHTNALRRTGTAVWRGIADEIEKEIADGAYAPGDKLPTEFEYAKRFGVNRHTVRRAIGHLVEKGLLHVEQGRGTFVHEHVVDYAVGKRTRFSEIVSGQDRAPGGTLVSSETRKADAAAAKALTVPRGTKLLVLRTLGQADGRPISLGDHMFRAAQVKGLDAAYERLGSLTKALAELGIDDYARRITKVTTRLPSREEAALLHQPANRPVLVSESINVTPDGAALEYGVTLFAGDRVQLTFEP
jgi:GntR family phosphonate transport system transcriptional regulator